MRLPASVVASLQSSNGAMRTRGQVHAWNEIAQQRRELAAFAAAIAESRREHEQRFGMAPTPAATARTNASANARNPQPEADTEVTPPPKRRRATTPARLSPAASARRRAPPQRQTRSSKKKQEPPAVVAQPQAPAEGPGPEPQPPMAPIRRALDYSSESEEPTPVAPEQPPVTLPPVSKKRTRDSSMPPPEPSVLVVTAATAPSISALSLSASSSVVGRLDERRAIESVLHGNPAAAFVLGPPGTGKSTCVADVASLASLTCVRLNCSAFRVPTALFSALDDQLRSSTAWRLPSFDADALSAFINDLAARSKSVPPVCAIVLDEVDYLLRLPSTVQPQVQDLLRFLVRWAHQPQSCIRFIGILNGMDMQARINAFLADDPHPTTVILFPSYSHEELVGILRAHVASLQQQQQPEPQLSISVEDRALELLARRIASRDGDARRALSLLQQIASSLQPHATTGIRQITLRDVLQCSAAALPSQSHLVKQIQHLPRQPKLLLYVITSLAPCDAGHTDLDAIRAELSSLQSRPALAWIPQFRQEELRQHISTLDCYALIKCSGNKRTAAGAGAGGSSSTAASGRLSATITMDTLRQALAQDELLEMLPF
ncbi:hypothetical protein P43SY_009579 [Pythium insidiosum]|uniref:AAA+ ATPase domain-containing protein n=1 Tax=Pythium insidiosum TaxID=114742 RepID=A0AAD5LJ36_PYTIN|nr:hypothetical protein P43SY_009579 [Pythium insidiosum]